MKFKDSEKIYKDEFIMNSRPYLRESLWYEFNLNSFANSLTYIHSVNKNRSSNHNSNTNIIMSRNNSVHKDVDEFNLNSYIEFKVNSLHHEPSKTDLSISKIKAGEFFSLSEDKNLESSEAGVNSC